MKFRFQKKKKKKKKKILHLKILNSKISTRKKKTLYIRKKKILCLGTL